jgi:hypothetical protein
MASLQSDPRKALVRPEESSRSLHALRRPQRRTVNALGACALAALLGATLSACGGAGQSIKASASSGRPGTVVTVSGNAGSGCVPGQNWFGFSFQRAGKQTTGPATALTAPVAASGSWSASFVVPSYLGGSTTRGPGAPITAGSYQFVTAACKSQKAVSTPFRVTTSVPAPVPTRDFVGIVATSDGQGYWLVRADGAVLSYGDAEPLTPLPAGSISAGSPIVAMARTYDGHGAWLVNSEGHVYELGDARSYGSLSSAKAAQAPITSMASTPNGRGYWLLAADGQVYGFGDGHLQGMPNSYSAPYDAIVARPAGGYIITGADDGENYAYPGALVLGGGPGYTMSATLVGGASTPSGNGTWLTGRDGGVYSFGTGSTGSNFYGSVPGDNVTLKAPITGMAASPDGLGYWLVGADGTVFTFGDAHSFGDPVST